MHYCYCLIHVSRGGGVLEVVLSGRGPNDLPWHGLILRKTGFGFQTLLPLMKIIQTFYMMQIT